MTKVKIFSTISKTSNSLYIRVPKRDVPVVSKTFKKRLLEITLNDDF